MRLHRHTWSTELRNWPLLGQDRQRNVQQLKALRQGVENALLNTQICHRRCRDCESSLILRYHN